MIRTPDGPIPVAEFVVREQKERIAKLEAENKKLRAALAVLNKERGSEGGN